MSEDTMTRLKATLSSLTNDEKAWVINFLVQGLLVAPPKKRAKKNRNDELSEEQWEEYFNYQPSVALPSDTIPLEEVLTATSGRTIKQMEKWL